MTNRLQWCTLGLAGWMLATSAATAQTSVSYGKITAVKPVAVENAKAQGAGALAGGTIGLVSGRGQSGSNQALRGVAGGVAGQQVAKRASTKQAFEYTLLMAGNSTITVVTDRPGCVWVTAWRLSAVPTSIYVWSMTSNAQPESSRHRPQPAMRLPATGPRTKF